MNEKDFKKHLQALARGHHHLEEHDWQPKPTKAEEIGLAGIATKRAKLTAAVKGQSQKKRARSK